MKIKGIQITRIHLFGVVMVALAVGLWLWLTGMELAEGTAQKACRELNQGHYDAMVTIDRTTIYEYVFAGEDLRMRGDEVEAIVRDEVMYTRTSGGEWETGLDPAPEIVREKCNVDLPVRWGDSKQHVIWETPEGTHEFWVDSLGTPLRSLITTTESGDTIELVYSEVGKTNTIAIPISLPTPPEE